MKLKVPGFTSALQCSLMSLRVLQDYNLCYLEILTVPWMKPNICHTSSAPKFVLFCFDFWPHPAMFRNYSWFCTLESLLRILRGLYGVKRLEPRLVSVLTVVLSGSPIIFFEICMNWLFTETIYEKNI